MTSKKKVTQPAVKPYKAWLLSNYGHPWVVVNRRGQAKMEAEERTGEPWDRCKNYCRITRCEVKPL